MVWNVRSRVTVLATAVVLAVLAVTGTALIIAQRQVLTDNVDEVLQVHSAEIARQIDAGTLPAVILGQGDDDAFAFVVDAGVTVASTQREPTVSVADVEPADGRASIETVRPAGGGIAYRVMASRHGDLVIVAGTPLDDVDDSVVTLTRGLWIAVPAASAVLAALVWLLVGRVLRPVEQIRTRVAAIGGGDLDRRVPEPRTRDEIALLARTMNEMLSRLEASSTRQRRFVADASHELRSPLARIRAEIEVDRAHPGSADPEATRRSVLEEVDVMQRLVEDLLTLARIDDDAAVVRQQTVDLDDVVLREVQGAAPPSRTVDVSGVSAAQVSGDPTQLARVVRNLLDNALRHGGLHIVVTLREQDGEAILAIADDGPGVPPALGETIFERFARADEARSAAAGGAGLGLAIVRDIVELHGGTVVLDPSHSAGARFVVRLPLPNSTLGRSAPNP
jgi:signal transduction histidine kinase